MTSLLNEFEICAKIPQNIVTKTPPDGPFGSVVLTACDWSPPVPTIESLAKQSYCLFVVGSAQRVHNRSKASVQGYLKWQIISNIGWTYYRWPSELLYVSTFLLSGLPIWQEPDRQALLNKPRLYFGYMNFINKNPKPSNTKLSYKSNTKTIDYINSATTQIKG